MPFHADDLSNYPMLCAGCDNCAATTAVVVQDDHGETIGITWVCEGCIVREEGADA